MEIEKVKLSEKGDWKYRITFGNLFGSDNQVFDSLETGIAVASLKWSTALEKIRSEK